MPWRKADHSRKARSPYLKDLAAFYREKGGYVPIRVEKDDFIVSQTNREVLKSIGVVGEMLATPGHSRRFVFPGAGLAAWPSPAT